MSVAGSISVAVDFNDTASDEGLEVLKKIRLASNDAYTAGKVIVVSGTVGTSSAVLVWAATAESSYANSAGDAVSITSISSISFYSPQNCRMIGSPISSGPLMASIGKVATASPPGAPASISVQGTDDTAEYVVVIYGT